MTTMNHARLALAFVLASAVACDAKLPLPKLGRLGITTSAPSVENPIATSDGWSITYNRFLVHMSALQVATSDGLVAASATPIIFDQASKGTKILLDASLRTARTWDSVTFEIGPIAKGEDATILVDPVKESDHTLMATGNLALYVEGKMTKNGTTKSFAWGFVKDTTYGDCVEGPVRGLVVPPDGNDTANLTMSGGILFADDLAEGDLRAEAIAQADANGDGIVTPDELKATTLDAARANGAYTTGDATDITDLGAFIDAQVPRVAAPWRSTGSCTPTQPTAL